MKRLLLFAALALAALTMRAQNPNRDNPSPVPVDSVSVMIRHLANTNAEVQYLNESLRLHSQIALGSFALEALGGACLWAAYYQGKDNLSRLGTAFCIAGGVGFLCSYLPIWTKSVRLDVRGLVIDIGKNNRP